MLTSYKLSEKEWNYNIRMPTDDIARNYGIFNVPGDGRFIWIDFEPNNPDIEEDELFLAIKSKLEKYEKDGLIKVEWKNHPYLIKRKIITISRK